MLCHFPSQISAGVSLRFDVLVEDNPAPIWSASAFLRGPQNIDLQSSPSGVAHAFEASAAQTGMWVSGDYAVSVRATDGVDVVELESGVVQILPDLSALAPGHDPRGHARRVLDAVEAVLEGRASKDQQSYTINGRSLVRTSISDLILLRDRYRREVADEVARASGAGGRRLTGRQIKVRFGP